MIPPAYLSIGRLSSNFNIWLFIFPYFARIFMNPLPVKLIFAGPQTLPRKSKRRRRAASKKAEIRVAAGSDCEVGVKRYAYCRRNPLSAITFQRRSGKLMWDGCASDGLGIKIVRFFRGTRDDSNRIIRYLLTISLIADKELPSRRKCYADWVWIAENAQHFTGTS